MNKKFWISLCLVFIIGIFSKYLIHTYLNIDLVNDHLHPIALGYYLAMAFVILFIKEIVNR